jgi:malonyl-CoA O-methyltransferase
MVPESPISPGPRDRDVVALARIARRISAAPATPWLHQEVARRMAERLAVLAKSPKWVLNWSATANDSSVVLQQALPKATVLRPAFATRPPAWWQRLASSPQPDFEAIAKESKAQLLWSNMQLHWAPSPGEHFAQWRDAMATGGLLFFSTLGPGTLAGLRTLYDREGAPPAMAPLVDMHDLGDDLTRAGFTDPVMDQETLTLTWPDAPALLAELRALGGNAHRDRFAGLRGRGWSAWQMQLLQDLRRHDGRLALEFEIVYGHAVRAPPRIAMGSNTQVSLEEMRRMMREGRL